MGTWPTWPDTVISAQVAWNTVHLLVCPCNQERRERRQGDPSLSKSSLNPLARPFLQSEPSHRGGGICKQTPSPRVTGSCLNPVAGVGEEVQLYRPRVRKCCTPQMVLARQRSGVGITGVLIAPALALGSPIGPGFPPPRRLLVFCLTKRHYSALWLNWGQ